MAASLGVVSFGAIVDTAYFGGIVHVIGHQTPFLDF
jgi:hypothetical protein